MSVKSDIKAFEMYGINEGEYFKVLKDNYESMIYIEKEDGSTGWINIDYNVDGRYDLNPAFFFLAG